MLRSLHEHHEAIGTLCSRFHVKTLYVFGSAATDEYDPRSSDIDFLVEFLPVERHGFKDVYFQLLDALESLLGRRVDLVESTAVRNPHFKTSIESTKVALYAAA